MGYDAFISYSHAADGQLAPRVQSALHRFAKPLLSLRALHVFRDQTSLAATPELWTTIVKALDQSRFFILMASPEAAASEWVEREVEHWLNASPTSPGGAAIGRLLIILTDGEIAWDTAAGDFDWRQTDALPRALSGAFSEEPLYVDMRVVKTASDLSLHNPGFRNQIADLAATISGRQKDELIGEDVRIVRRNRRLAWSAGITLALLAAIAGVMAFVATVQRDAALSRERAAQAVSQLAVDPHESLKLAIEGVEIDATDEAMLALREALLRSHLRARLNSNGAVSQTRFAPDGSRVLATVCSPDGDDCGLRLWRSPTGEPICEVPDARTASFSSDGEYLVTAGGSVLDVETCQAQPLEPSEISLVQAPQRKYEVAGIERYTDQQPFILEIETGDARKLPVLRDPVGGQVFDPDNRYVVTWSDESWYSESGGGPTEIGDKAVRLWHVEYADEDRVLVGHDRATNTAAFSADSSFIVTGSDDRTARIWIRDTGEQFAVLRGHSSGVVEVAVSPDGGSVVTVERDGQAWLWQPGTTAPGRAQLKDLFALRHDRSLPDLEGEAQPIRMPVPSRDGSVLLAPVDLQEIAVWDAATGTRRALLTDHAGYRLRGRPCADGRQVVTVNGDPAITAGDDQASVWLVESGQIIATLEGETLFAAACSPDGEIIVGASAWGTIFVWDAATFDLSKRIDLEDGGRILDIAFNSDGSRFVTAHRDAVARIWDARTLEPVQQLAGHSGGVLGATFSPDDRLVVTVGDDHTRVWDAATGKQIGDYLGNGDATPFVSHDCSQLVIGARIHSFGACGSDDVVLARARERTDRISAQETRAAPP